MKKTPAGKSKNTALTLEHILLATVFVIVFIGTNIGAYYYAKRTIQKAPSLKSFDRFRKDKAIVSSPTPTKAGPTPTPAPRPLPQGPETYTVSIGQGFTGPRFTKITYDPLDPKAGKKQTVTMNISAKYPAASVKAEFRTDKKVTPYTMTLKEENEREQVWELVRTADDTHLYRYQVEFAATGKDGTSKTTTTVR